MKHGEVTEMSAQKTETSTIENTSRSRRRICKRTSSAAPVVYISLQVLTLSLLAVNSPEILHLDSISSYMLLGFSALSLLFYLIAAFKNPGYLAASTQDPSHSRAHLNASVSETQTQKKEGTPRIAHSSKVSVLTRGFRHSRKERSRSALDFASIKETTGATNTLNTSAGESEFGMINNPAAV